MQNLYDEVGSLDKRSYEEFALSEDILMENASLGISRYIRSHIGLNSKITVVCGSGNNGADGIAVARQLHGDYDVSIYYAKKPKSQMAILQAKRAKNLKVQESAKLKDCDVLVDALVGTGFSGKLNEDLQKIMRKMNSMSAFKIACDIPSAYEFFADVTLTMGGLKKSMYLDIHKDSLGDVEVINLGISRNIYEIDSNYKVLDLKDLELPHRGNKNTHKGNYGHLAVLMGAKKGASLLSSKAGFNFGAGLVTLVCKKEQNIDDNIMQSIKIPKNTTALALGMGLADEKGHFEISDFLDNELPLVADADIFSSSLIYKILKRKNVVITPHPKEFVEMLRVLDITDITVEKLQENRFKYVELFTKKYNNVVLLLKGANVIISLENKVFINPHGNSSLAKGGSGDVLSGMISSLLAQGYSALSATINASLAHAKLSINYNGASFSLTPDDLIAGIKQL